MEIYVTDDRLGGYFRRYQLALRMMAHGARTQTAVAWSGLTRDQLVTQRRRWGFGPDDRRRGPAPSAFHVFFRTRRHRSEATVFASMCRVIGTIAARFGKGAAVTRPGNRGALLRGAAGVPTMGTRCRSRFRARRTARRRRTGGGARDTRSVLGLQSARRASKDHPERTRTADFAGRCQRERSRIKA